MSTEIVFIGTGDAFGSGGRRNSAILVRNAGHTLLLDCGVTTLVGLKQLGIDPREIDAIALSHYHADHFGGVPFLLLDYEFEHTRSTPLDLLGPPQVMQRIHRFAEACGFASERPPSHPLRATEFEVDRPIELDGFRIVPMPAHHAPHTLPHMLRVDIDGGKSLVFSGDTGWHEELPARVGNADLFICECVFVDDDFEYHLNARRLDAERSRFDCGEILLTHLGSQVLENPEKVHFDVADDGMKLSL